MASGPEANQPKMAKEPIPVRLLVGGKYGIVVGRHTNEALQAQLEELVLPHRHDHYTCFLLEQGQVRFNVDFQTLEGGSQPCLLVSVPGQVHELKHATEATGWFMAFEARFVDAHARMAIEQSFASVALLLLNKEDLKWFVQMFELIEATVNTTVTPFWQQLVQTLVNAFFLKAVAVFQLQEEARIQSYSSRSIEIAKQYQQLVRAHFTGLKKPADYAARMSITVSYLNDTVKAVTGFSATRLIQEEIFREAQRLLFYTSKNVQEIAFELGYEDFKYFIRLFRKTVGTSPSSFRKNNPRS
jgi:AraC-like DNA-binding protein